MTNPDFSYPFQIDKLGPNPKKIHIESDAAQKQALIERFNLLSLDQFKGTCMLERLNGKKVNVQFNLETQYAQTCVVTAKPVKNRQTIEFERTYDPDFKEADFEEDEEVEISLESDVEPVIDGMIDLGSALAEEFSLELDPFPRVEGAAFQDYGIGPEITTEEVEAANPFAVLAKIKNKSE